MTPNRVNRAYWTTKEKKTTNHIFFVLFLSTEKHTSNGPKWDRDFFHTNLELANILGRTDLYFDVFFLSGSNISGIPGPHISRNVAWARLGPGLGQR